MKATLDCLVCVVTQTLRVARLATHDSELQRAILDETLKRLPGMDLEMAPAELCLPVYELTAAITGNLDPYRKLRYKQNEAVLAIEPELRALVRNSDEPLVTALHLTAAGNVIDLGINQQTDIDIHAAIRQAMEERFAVDHTPAFLKSLARSKNLLYLLDNAGEIVFDKILIEELLKHTSVTAVVKAGPMINDVIMDDAEQVGLTSVCEVIDNGGAFIGSPLNLVSAAFLERMQQADMIVGKGQGNYETVDDFPGDVFFILKAKCDVIAAHMGVSRDQVGLISMRVRRGAR